MLLVSYMRRSAKKIKFKLRSDLRKFSRYFTHPNL